MTTPNAKWERWERIGRIGILTQSDIGFLREYFKQGGSGAALFMHDAGVVPFLLDQLSNRLGPSHAVSVLDEAE